MDALTDIHCHIIPYVDDGAENLEEARMMLQQQAQQGVSVVIATPHARRHMFETPPEKIQEHFEQLQQVAMQIPSAPKLLLGREYYCGESLLPQLYHAKLKPLGDSNFLLLEFSTRCQLDEVFRALELAVSCGYHPVVAHAERYVCFQESPSVLGELLPLGAWIQLNAESVLGQAGLKQKWRCAQWIRSGWVHFIASDSHHTDVRAPNLGRAALYIEKKFGKARAREIFWENPGHILGAAQSGEVEQRDEADTSKAAGASV